MDNKEIIILMKEIIGSIKKRNYCAVDNCLLPRYHKILCKNHYEDYQNTYFQKIKCFKNMITSNDIDYDEIYKVYSMSHNPEKTYENKDDEINIREIINDVNETLNFYNEIDDSNMINDINQKYRILVENKINYVTKSGLQVYFDNFGKVNITDPNNPMFNSDLIFDIYKMIFNYDYNLRKSEYITNIDNAKCDMVIDIFRDCCNKINNKYKINDANIYKYLKNAICTTNLNVHIEREKYVNINYNTKLYTELAKLYNKYNIVYYTNEKTFCNLKFVSMLRYDVFGILINKKDMQLYYFIIEYDDDSHFGKTIDKNIIYKDIMKDIFGWYKCFSILRIHYLDDIHEQINAFFYDITEYQTPIFRYSKSDIYFDRLRSII